MTHTEEEETSESISYRSQMTIKCVSESTPLISPERNCSSTSNQTESLEDYSAQSCNMIVNRTIVDNQSQLRLSVKCLCSLY